MNYANVNNNSPNINQQKNAEKECDKSGLYIYTIFHILMSLVAIFLSVRCKGVTAIDIIVAILCPYVYIIYSIITHNGICEQRST